MLFEASKISRFELNRGRKFQFLLFFNSFPVGDASPRVRYFCDFDAGIGATAAPIYCYGLIVLTLDKSSNITESQGADPDFGIATGGGTTRRNETTLTETNFASAETFGF